ncbi:MAG: hypothetical protein IT347_13840 [Candidatus Eisenbacteria bacterium]|nr:hypothetical protein [Candidatus Eisenbacteria bacterium]
MSAARRARGAAAIAALLGLAMAGSGCDRTPSLVPAGADSIRANPDTLAILARAAASRWDAGDDEQGSALSARVVLEALRLRPNAPWPERSRALLDSLGVSAEVSGDDRLVVVNMFSRASGGDASYPYLFWRDGGPHMQPLETQDLRLVAVTARGFDSGAEAGDSARAAVLWGRRVSSGQQPLLMVWRHAKGGRWDLAQTLGADSLGGVGTGEFSGADTSLALTTRTYRPTPFFDECPTCPHVFHERRFAWRPAGFVRTDDQIVPSPYVAFTSFVAALVADDRDLASRFATDPSLVDFARRYEWNQSARGRWRVAPGTADGTTSMVFLRGASEAFRVAFEPRDGDWVVAGFEPTTAPIE